ncbi:MAG: cytochrome C [Burkholderiales bacterium]|nr:cytochrome C [Burkholderiales bacterium]
MTTRRRVATASALAALFWLAFTSVAAGEEERQTSATPLLPKYRQECAACHIAYPPGMLPAESWRRILSDLDHHFGQNASLDAASVKELEGWLTAHAAKGGRAASAPPQDRITRSRWFIAEHGEVPASAWRLPAVKSASNCIACHTQADRGNFDERYIRIPR